MLSMIIQCACVTKVSKVIDFGMFHCISLFDACAGHNRKKIKVDRWFSSWCMSRHFKAIKHMVLYFQNFSTVAQNIHKILVQCSSKSEA